MADTAFAPRPVRQWFWWGAVGVLLFMLVGVGGYLATVTTPVQLLPVDRQLLSAAMPAWHTPIYAVAVWSGLAGAILLLLRRRWSVPLLLVALLGAIGTFLPYALVPEVRGLASAGDGLAATIVIGLCLASLWFARHSQQKGWLR